MGRTPSRAAVRIQIYASIGLDCNSASEAATALVSPAPTPAEWGTHMIFIASLDLVGLAFGVFNLLRLASYVPQIAAVARAAWRDGNFFLVLVHLGRR